MEDQLNNLSEKEKARREKISKANKGKLKGTKPQKIREKISASMKGKNTAPKSEDMKFKLSQTKKGKPSKKKGYRESEETKKKKKSESMKGKSLNFLNPEIRNNKISQALKGRISKTKGKHFSEETRRKRNIKYYDTMKKNNSFNKENKSEIKLHQLLISLFGENAIKYQYSSECYPFKCDFYIESLDCYIELEGNPRHGNHPFDNTNKDDLEVLEKLKKPSSTSWNSQIIYNWVDLDVRKLRKALENNLKYIMIYDHSKIIKNIYSYNIPEKDKWLLDEISMKYL